MIVEKIDELLVEKAMGKKLFRKVVAKIGNDAEANDSMDMRKLWLKWDKKVGGSPPHDLYIDEILWRVFDSKKLWDQFVKDWTKLGFKI